MSIEFTAHKLVHFNFAVARENLDTALTLFGDSRALLNMTVWRSVETLKAFTYQGLHKAALKRRSEWFLPPTGPAYVLWWMPAAETPTFEDAKHRLQRLATLGPTSQAFNFQTAFEPPYV